MTARRERLDAIGVTVPLEVPPGAPRDAVLESLLSQAVDHVRRVSDALQADPAARADGQRAGTGVEETGEDGTPA